MHVTSASPLRVASRVWPTARGGWTLTVVCKATYRLQPGESPLHDAQEPVQDEDTYWNDDPTRSLSAATDLAPFKPRADVVLVGSAYAPGKVPARSVVARLILGDLDKSLEAWCDRAWAQDGQLREGARAVKFPLRYERAAGGPESWNPVGVRRDAPPDAYGMVPLPSLQPPGLHITRRDDFIEPIGFGPIAPTWPWRWDRLGRHAGVWPHDRWWEQPLPEGFDPGFFNIAPRDQQLQELHDNERFVLENLHPEHPRLVTNLPGVRPRAIADRGSIGREEIPLLCDTLWIDTDRGLCTLVWRGRLSLIHAEEPSRVIITAERASSPIAPQSPETAAPDARVSEPPPTQPRVSSGRVPEINETNTAELIDVEADEEDADVLRTRAVALEVPAAAAPVLPFGPAPAATPRCTVPAPSAASANLPFAGAKEGPASSVERVDTGTKYPPLMPAASPAGSRAALPFSPSAEPPAPITAPPPSAPGAIQPSSVPAVTPALWVAPVTPPPLVVTPPVAEAPRLSEPSSPWEASGSAAVPKQTVGQSAANAMPDVPTPRVQGAKFESPPTKQPLYRDVLELLWYDPEGMQRIRRHPSWKKIIADARPKSLSREPDEEIPPDKRQDARDRRDATAILAKGDQVTDIEGLRRELDGAVNEEGIFVPPLVILSGEIEPLFDELETLKATVAVATPVAGGDKRTKDAVDASVDFLTSPYVQMARSVAEGYVGRIREAFRISSLNIPPRYLESHVERVLLEQGYYQKRRFLSRKWIRTLLTMSGLGQPLPTYIPEESADGLPLFSRFKVRVIGEASQQLDERETEPVALRVLVVARWLRRVR